MLNRRPAKAINKDLTTVEKTTSSKGLCVFFMLCRLSAVVLFLLLVTPVFAETFKITAYCPCKICCGINAQGITASGKKAKYGYIACNWLKFGTKVHIEGLGNFVVMDRGAKSLFGSKDNHIKHLDVFLPSHSQALKFGVKYLNVEVLNE